MKKSRGYFRIQVGDCLSSELSWLFIEKMWIIGKQSRTVWKDSQLGYVEKVAKQALAFLKRYSLKVKKTTLVLGQIHSLS